MLEREFWHKRITEQRIFDAVDRRMTSLDDPGFCLLCGADAHGVEPDARDYKCESCGQSGVYGVEELILVL